MATRPKILFAESGRWERGKEPVDSLSFAATEQRTAEGDAASLDLIWA
jgi:hypothetical protein